MNNNGYILLVDDMIWRRREIKSYLQNYGYSIILAVNGKTALTQIARYPIKLVITDTNMPVMNGLELVKKIVRLYPEIPIIGMSKRLENKDKYKIFWHKDDPMTNLLILVQEMLTISQ